MKRQVDVRDMKHHVRPIDGDIIGCERCERRLVIALTEGEYIPVIDHADDCSLPLRDVEYLARFVTTGDVRKQVLQAIDAGASTMRAVVDKVHERKVDVLAALRYLIEQGIVDERPKLQRAKA